MFNKELIEVEAEITEILYQNDETNFYILNGVDTTYKKEIIFKGKIEDFSVNRRDVLIVKGIENIDNKGVFIEIKEAIYNFTKTNKAFKEILTSVKGIGEKIAEKITEHFKEDTLSIIEGITFREDLRKIGIKDNIIDNIDKELRNKTNSLRSFLRKTSSRGIPVNIGYKAYKAFKGDFLYYFHNPYSLYSKTTNLNLKDTDYYAYLLLGNSYNPYNINRLRLFFLTYLSNNIYSTGNTYVLLKEVERDFNLFFKNNTVNSLLVEIREDILINLINKLIEEEEVIMDIDTETGETFIAPKGIFYTEKFIAENIKERIYSYKSFNVDYSIDKIIREIEVEEGVIYDVKQKQAIKEAIINPITVITGGPGTGKTTIINGLVRALNKLNLTFKLTAPTGKAADRITEATFEEAFTIHKALGLGYSNNNNNNNHFIEEKFIDTDFFIVDEVSMIDTFLTYKILKNTSKNTKIVLIGDTDQLNAVNPGYIVGDIIDSMTVKTVTLNSIYRQSSNSNIITNSYKVRDKDIDLIEGEDFYLIDTKDYRHKTIEMYIEASILRFKEAYNYKDEDIQVLTPQNKGKLGVKSLNVFLQEIFNTKGKNYINTNGYKIAEGDRVIQIRNNYDKEVFNGMTGKVIEVVRNREGEQIMVRYREDLYVSYDEETKEEIELAYSTTIHKAQGSENKVIIIPVTEENIFMFNSKTVYTAITRAKEKVVIIGDIDLFKQSIKKHIPRRKTRLLINLREAFGIIEDKNASLMTDEEFLENELGIIEDGIRKTRRQLFLELKGS